MNFVKRLLMVAGAVAVAGVLSIMLTPKAAHALVSTLVTVVNTSANPVPTSAQGTTQVAGSVNLPTHLGQNPDSLVTLRTGVVQFFQQLADGSSSSSPFAIPAGDELIVTDIEWRVCDPSKAVGASQTFLLAAGPFDIYDTVGTILGPDLCAAGAEHLTSGIVLSVTPQPAFAPPVNGSQVVFVHGYLVPAPIIAVVP